MHKYLLQHPQIYLPLQKETKHFVADERYVKGLSHYERSFFGSVSSETAIGEVDPDYIYFPVFLKRISKHINLEKLKFIFIFRNPVERAFSHYLMTYRRGIETKTFTEAIDLEAERIKKDFFSRMHFSYVDRGFYIRQLSPFLEVLRPEQILFLLTEDLHKDTRAVLKKCFDFLEVDNHFNDIDTSIRYHQATVPRSEFLLNAIVRKKDTFSKKIIRLLIPDQQIRQRIRAKILDFNQSSNQKRIYLKKSDRIRLVEKYQHENQKLADLIKRDISHWNKTERL